MNPVLRIRRRAALIPLVFTIVGGWVGCGDSEPTVQRQSKRGAGGAVASSSSTQFEGGASAIAGAPSGGLTADEAGGSAGAAAGALGVAGARASDDAGGAGGAGTAGATGDAAGAGVVEVCPEPPAATPLVGWAAVSGKGIDTTTGGGDAPPVVVSSYSQLQSRVAGTTPAVIYVQGVMAAGDLVVGSNKTIVGLCGAELHGHVHLSGSTNVIVRNIKVIGYGVGDCALDPDYDATVGCSSGHDAISVLNNAHHVYFDHCDVSDGTDGNLDISNGADFVTVSYTKFHYTPRTDPVGNDSTGKSGHRYSNLVGGTDTPTYPDATSLNVTWHHNWWADGVMQRMPRVRFGKNHLFNNLYNSSGNGHCVRAGIQAQILIENSVFSSVNNPQQFNSSTDQTTANITASSTENLYLATTGTIATGGGGPAFTTPPYAYELDAVSVVADLVQREAGPK